MSKWTPRNEYEVERTAAAVGMGQPETICHNNTALQTGYNRSSPLTLNGKNQSAVSGGKI